jgi:hypothetical protein
MANWELELLAGILVSEDPSEAFKQVLSDGVTQSVLYGMESRSVWAHVHAHYTRPHRYGFVPSLDAILESFPTLDLPTPSENLLDLCLRVKQAHTRRQTELLIDQYREDESDDPIAAAASLYSSLGCMQALQTNSRDVSFRQQAYDDILMDLRSIAENDGVTGLPYPWDIMNQHTGGIQPGDMLLFWAVPKSRKTWVGLVIAAHLFLLGYRVLVYSKEMMWKQIRQRLACIIGKVSYDRFKKNLLTRAELHRMLTAMALLKSDNQEFSGELIFTDCDRPDGSIGGPSEVRQKIDMYEPKFVLLDSAYLLQIQGVVDAMDWKAIGATTRNLKQVAKSTGVPTACIMQENEKAAAKYKGRGTASIAMFTGIAADCDVGIKLVCNDYLDEVSLHFAACRETNFPGFTIHANLAENFEFAGLHLHKGDDEDEGKSKAAEPAPAAAPPTTGATAFTSRYTAVEEPTDELSQDLNDLPFDPEDEG